MKRLVFGMAVAAAIVGAHPAVAQTYGAGAPAVGIPNGLSGPGGTVTFSPAPATPDLGAPAISGALPARRGAGVAAPRPRLPRIPHHRRAS